MKVIPLEMEEKTTKKRIIEILSKEWPLTAKKIYNNLKKEYSLSITYQAVHKTMDQLVEKKVLIKKEREYIVNVKWLEGIEEFIENIKSEYAKNMHLFGIKNFNKEGDTQTFIFESLGDAEEYRKKLQKEYILQPMPKPPYCGISKNYKSPLVYSEKSLKILDLIKENLTSCYMIIKGDTIIDKWCANYYRNNPLVMIKTGIDLSNNCETMILGDLIFQTYIPQKTQEFISSQYKNAKKNADINVPLFYKEIYRKKQNIKVIVLKNPELAKQLREQVLSFFDIKKASFFDIDGTLVKNFSMLDFAKYLTKKGKFKKEKLNLMISLFKEYKNKKINYDNFANEFLKTYAGGIEGNIQKDIYGEAVKFVESNKLNFFDYSRELFNLMSGKTQTIAVTATTEEIMKAIQKKLPFDIIISSKLSVQDGKFTGDLDKNLTSKEMKMKEIHQYLQKIPVNFINSFAFGDTTQDLATLELVGHPIVLNPNSELKDIIKDKGWISLTEDDDIIKHIKSI